MRKYRHPETAGALKTDPQNYGESKETRQFNWLQVNQGEPGPRNNEGQPIVETTLESLQNQTAVDQFFNNGRPKSNHKYQDYDPATMRLIPEISSPLFYLVTGKRVRSFSLQWPIDRGDQEQLPRDT